MARRCPSYQASRRRWSVAAAGAVIGERRSGDMAGPEQIRDDFVRVVQHPDAALDLARAALLVAAEADPRVDIDGQLHTLDEVTGGRLEFDDRLLASVSKRDMITRLLRNLKGAYLRADDDEGALAAVERLLLLSPDDP